MQKEKYTQRGNDCDRQQCSDFADCISMVWTKEQTNTTKNPPAVHRIQGQQIKAALDQSAYGQKRKTTENQQAQETTERPCQCTEQFFF